jgi:hypothetical protein
VRQLRGREPGWWRGGCRPRDSGPTPPINRRESSIRQGTRGWTPAPPEMQCPSCIRVENDGRGPGRTLLES